MKKQRVTATLLLLLLISSLVFLYPDISDYWNEMHQTKVIAHYEETLNVLQETDYTDVLAAAQAYNQALAAKPKAEYENGAPVDANYATLLDVNNSDMMGYITIDKLDVSLPIYHGTADSALAVGTGHLEGSSLPVGGAGTHSVITGHRGLATATLFTNLDEMEKGDVFTLTVLSQVLTYQVDQIVIVPPYDVEPLAIAPDQDYCTLVTCTPFGINTDRILVRGTRVENIEAPTTYRVVSEAVIIDPVVVAPFLIVPVILLLLVLSFCSTGTAGTLKEPPQPPMPSPPPKHYT